LVLGVALFCSGVLFADTPPAAETIANPMATVANTGVTDVNRNEAKPPIAEANVGVSAAAVSVKAEETPVAKLPASDKPAGIDMHSRACLQPPNYDLEIFPTTSWQTTGEIVLPNAGDCYIVKIAMDATQGYDFSCCVNDAVGGSAPTGDCDYTMFDSSGTQLWYIDGPSACGYDATTLGSAYAQWHPPANGDYYLMVEDYYGSTITFTMAYKRVGECMIDCPTGGIPEGEPDCYDEYVDSFNGGCNSAPPYPFSPIACGDTICGKYGTYLYQGNSYRDTDWYVFTLTQAQQVTWTVTGEASNYAFILTGVCPTTVIAQGGPASPCDPAVATAALGPGTYYVWAGPSVFTGVPCGKDYVATLTCTDLPTGACCVNEECVATTTQPDCPGTWFAGESCPSFECPGCIDYTVDAPGTWNGTTCGAGNDCALRPSEEVIYAVQLPYVSNWRVSLCGSSFDTYLYVGTTCCGQELGYNDDYCGVQSQLDVANVGGTIYVDIEAYGSATCGDYILTVTDVACSLTCPTGGIQEGEPDCYDGYVDMFNGGCNSSPYVFSPIACGDTVCGKYGTYLYNGSSYRDTDWYQLVLAQDMTVTWEVTGEAATAAFILTGTCPTSALASGTADACGTATVSAILAPGTYYLFAGPNVFTGVPCGADYIATLACEPYNPNPCDTCANACVIPSVPYDTTGNSCGFVNNYDEVCPYSGSTAPDVVYSFTPATDMYVDINLCNDGTDYDTKLYVYEDVCPGTVVGCNDDACSTPQFPSAYVSRLPLVALSAGHTYYIVVDGYGTNCGNYHLTIIPAEVEECPPGATLENEPVCYDDYVDLTNGGCNSAPTYPFQPITCGETYCGESGTYLYSGSSYRDTDWFALDLTATSTLTWSVWPTFPVQVFIINGGSGNCSDYSIIASASGPAAAWVTISVECAEPGLYWMWVGPSSFSGIACGSDWIGVLDCDPCTGACCLPEAPFCTVVDSATCEGMGGAYLGAFTSCNFAEDCNVNGSPDACDSALCDGSAWCDDCNNNGLLDYCDVPAPWGNCTVDCSEDCQPDGVPDECQLYTRGRACDALVYDAGACDGTNGTRPTVGWNDTGIIDKFCVPQGQNILTFSCVHVELLDFNVNPMNTMRVRFYALPTGSIPTDLPSFAAATPIFDYTYTVASGELTQTQIAECYPSAPSFAYDTTGPAYTFAPGCYAMLVNFPGSGAVNYWAKAVDDGYGNAYVWGVQVDVPSVATMPVAWNISGAGGPPPNDCNENEIPDDCDIQYGTSIDCDGNGVPDECEGCDLNGDDVYNYADFLVFADAFGSCASDPEPNKYVVKADMDCDGCINLKDYGLWLECYLNNLP